MPDGLLDPSSDEYRTIAGLIQAAHRRVGGTASQRWNGAIGVLPTLSRQRSRSDLDGTIRLHTRNVIAPLVRASGGADARWWYPRAARDAAYNVIYEALRQSSEPALRPVEAKPGQALNDVLAPSARGLDQALCEQRTYEIAEQVLAENGLGHVYVEDPPEAAALGGHGLSAGMVTPFRLTPTSVTATAAVRGFVDEVHAHCGGGRDELVDMLVTQPKGSRWSLAAALVAEHQHPGATSELDTERAVAVYGALSRDAAHEWSRLTSLRAATISTVDAATHWGHAIGRDTATRVVAAGKEIAGKYETAPNRTTQDRARQDQARQPRAGTDVGGKAGGGQDGGSLVEGPGRSRELNPAEVLAAQAPPGGTQRSDVGAAAAQNRSTKGAQLDR
ncbi:hypothetical protein [Kribbella sp. NPDC003557]|uniref:hypothetical protein n=1 Tax=Kribbella sp. NPDC003557 TaxID=3154449 RepID=UPI0033BB238D